MCERSRRSTSQNRFVENGEPIGCWRPIGVSVLLVLAFASCGTSETKSVDGRVSVGREPAGVDSAVGSGPDLAQSSEGTTGITEDPAALGDFGHKIVKTADLGLRSEEVRRSA